MMFFPEKSSSELAAEFNQNEQNRQDIEMFRRYIHTCSCSDECGWFAFFSFPEDFEAGFEYRVNGFETEEEAVRALAEEALNALKSWKKPIK